MKITLLSLLLVLSTFVLIPSANAADPCADDREKLCKDIVPGSNRLTQCFGANEKKLSPECRKFQDGLKERLKTVKDVCQDDFERYCSDKQAGRGDIRKCLMQNRPKLSKVCRRQLINGQKLKEAKKQQKKAKAKKANNA